MAYLRALIVETETDTDAEAIVALLDWLMRAVKGLDVPVDSKDEEFQPDTLYTWEA